MIGANAFYNAGTNAAAGSLEGVKVIDAQTVQVKLEKPSISFLYILANSAASIVPKEAVEKYGDKMHVGTGPFMLANIANDTSNLVLVRNNNYYGVDSLGNQLPFLDSIKISYVDNKQAELDLEAAKIDLTVARANFYPSLGLSASLGFQAFSPIYLARVPESIMGSLIGDLAGPVINRYAIRAGYANANARQIQAIYNYERTVLNAYIEVVNQLSNINNLEKSFDLKTKEVEALNQSTTISNRLFASARADYMEVLLTQRDALESKFELIETKMKQMNAMVNIYRALGGGWN